jgi:flagellar hook-basal body complex protein FliE
MAADPISAARAYLDAAKAAQRATTARGGDDGVDFGAMVQTAIADAASSVRVADQAGVASATGRTDIVDVVTAIAQAETTLETVIAVRDQVIQAYQEIMRMPI